MSDKPIDLQTVAQPDTNKDYFNFKATGLKIGESYAIKFQWVYDDGTLSPWSPGYFVNTSTENVPAAPSATVPSSAIGNIPVTLSAFPTNAKRVDIYIIGGVYGTGKVADSFFGAGTKNIPVTAGVYQVSLITVTPSGINGDPTNTFTITISNVVTEDTTAPDPISAGVVSGGVHPQDSSGQLGYLNVAVTNATIPSDFAGYIVKIVSSTNTWTQTFNSSTALSNLYITGGLFVGQAYTISVATTDGKNISNYVSCTPAPYTINDTRTNTSTVTGNLSFSATDSILTVSWVASTDPYVDSYRVQVTSNADTNFSSPLQTVESKGTTATFGGLTANTTYRVRVTARYSGATGALSTNHTTGTFTLDASGAISDGIAPTTNPALQANMVKSLFGAFAITFPPVANSDAVTYEVFIKQDNATGIVDNAYKVLEVGGTFAVVKTLANRTTALSYGTDYYIAIRAKDNDGISTGTVTAVGPVQTLQVANADLAADSVYANNIKAGEIDATKLVSDVVLASQKITVGSNTALDRVRLDATDATISGSAVSSRIYIGGGNYYDNASPFYADNLGRLSIGQKLKFENGELTINGKGTFTGTVTAGSGLNSVVVGNDVNGTNDGIYIGATGDYIYTDGTLRLGNGGITYSSGVLSVSGDITANALAADALITSPVITGGSYKTASTVGDGSVNSFGIKIDSSGIYGYPSNSSTASFSFTNSGLLTANGGTIGGWEINSNTLRSGANANRIILNPLTPKIALINNNLEKITIDPIEGIVGPSITYGSQQVPSFKLTPNGDLTLYGSINVIGGNAATSDQVNAKNKTFYQNDEPTNPINGYSLVAGDIWFDLNDNNKQYRWSGSAWQAVQDGTIVTAYNAAIAAQSAVQNKLNKSSATITDVNNNITAINANGISLFATGSTDTSATSVPSSGNRIIINYEGIQAYDSQGPSFQLLAGGGSATFRGSIESGSTITGARVQTQTDSYYGSIRMGYAEGFGLGSTLEVVGSNGVVTGQLYQFNNGNELILRHGSSREVSGYPTNSASLSLNPYTTSLGYTGPTGISTYEINISSTGNHTILGSLTGIGNGTIASSEFRNISAGTAPKSTSDSSGYIGDIYIQF